MHMTELESQEHKAFHPVEAYKSYLFYVYKRGKKTTQQNHALVLLVWCDPFVQKIQQFNFYNQFNRYDKCFLCKYFFYINIIFQIQF